MSDPAYLNCVRGEEITLGERRFKLKLVELRGTTIYWDAVDLETGEGKRITVDGKTRGVLTGIGSALSQSLDNKLRTPARKRSGKLIAALLLAGSLVAALAWGLPRLGKMDQSESPSGNENGEPDDTIAAVVEPEVDRKPKVEDKKPPDPPKPPEPEKPDPKVEALRASLDAGEWLDSASYQRDAALLRILFQQGNLRAGEFISVYEDSVMSDLIRQLERKSLKLRDASKNQGSLGRLAELGNQDARDLADLISSLDELDQRLAASDPLDPEDFRTFETLLERLSAEGDSRAGRELDNHRNRSRAIVHLNSGRPLTGDIIEKYETVFESLLNADDVPRDQQLRLCQQLGLYALLLEKNKTRALGIFKNGAEKGDPASMVQYAQLAGELGVSDPPRLTYLQRAANLGYPDGKALLAEFYHTYGGSTPDEVRRLFTDAADHGNARAQFKLGLYHWKGDGVPIDLDKAERYLTDSMGSGFKPAISNLGAFYWSQAFSKDATRSTRERFEKKAVLTFIEGARKSDLKSVQTLLTCLRESSNPNFSTTDGEQLTWPIRQYFSEADLIALEKNLKGKKETFVTEGLKSEFDIPTDA